MLTAKMPSLKDKLEEQAKLDELARKNAELDAKLAAEGIEDEKPRKKIKKVAGKKLRKK